MSYRCCICEVGDGSREGKLLNGVGVPLCAEHAAQSYWRSRQPELTKAEPSLGKAQQQLMRAGLASAGY